MNIYTPHFVKRLFSFVVIIALFFGTAFAAFADDFVSEEEAVDTNTSNSYTLDSDNTGGDVRLQFGTTLAEYLEWNDGNNQFELSDDLSLFGTALTLDGSNAGVGNDVNIVANQGSDSDGTLRYNATTNQWELSNDGGAFVAISTGLASDLAAVQARRTTDYSPTTSFVDITLDTTDFENDASVIEHDNTNTDQIDILENGIYLVAYRAQGDVAAGAALARVFGQVRVNDTTVIPGTAAEVDVWFSSAQNLTASAIVSLSAGDFVTLQLSQEVTAETITFIADTVLSVTKLEGVQGPQGLAGSVGLGTDEVSFTIDQDNAGAGVNVDLIANQGSDSDGTLRYNATSNLWQISNDGGTFYDIHLANVFDGYDNAGNAGVTQTETVLNIDTARVSDSAYTLAGDEVMFNQDGLYRLTGRLSVDSLNTTGTQRSSIQLRFEEDTTGAFLDVPGALCQDYMREQANGISSASCSITWIGSFNATDEVRLTHEMTGTTTGQTVPQGSGLTIELIRTE